MSWLKRPGLGRCLWMIPLFFGIGVGIMALVRWLEGLGSRLAERRRRDHLPRHDPDGIPRRDRRLRLLDPLRDRAPDGAGGSSGHGASWKDYFRVNTDHKVIGVQYIVTSPIFFLIGGLLAMVFRAELANSGSEIVDTQTFNGLVSVHASLLIFLFVIPVFAGIGNYVIPLMIGAPDMAFPRLNALSFWLLPIAGVMMLASFLVPGGAPASGWTAYAPLSIDQPLGACSSTWPSSGRGRRRS